MLIDFILGGMTKYDDCNTFYLFLSLGSAIIDSSRDEDSNMNNQSFKPGDVVYLLNG